MKLKPCLGLLALPLAISSAWAEGDSSNFSFSGFGTAAETRSNTNDAEFIRRNQAAGATRSFDFGVDSLLGLQGAYKFNDRISATVQGLVRKDATDKFGGEFSWAFARIKVSDALTVRLGRMGLPVYMVSDFRNVGYANTMLRPPVEVYSQVPLENVDGADMIYQNTFGDTTFTAQLAYGRTEPNLRGMTSSVMTDVSSIQLLAENGPFTLRAGRTAATMDVHAPGLDMLVGMLNQAGLPNIANSVAIVDSRGSFTSFGFGLDWKNILVQAEHAQLRTRTLAMPSTSSWYTMIGYRFGKFLPYYNHASASQDSPRSVAGIPDAGLAAAVNGMASSAPLQTSNSVGVRWDFHQSAALKVQVDRFSPHDSHGTFLNAKPGFSGPVTVLGVGVDFAF